MRNNRDFVLGMSVLPIVLLGLGIAFAGSVTTPNTFVAGATAVAAEVNANFAAHETAINDNDARIAINAGELASLTSRVEALEAKRTVAGYVIFDGSGTILSSWMADGGTVSLNHSRTGWYDITWGSEFFDHETDPVSVTMTEAATSHTYRSVRLMAPDNGQQRIATYLSGNYTDFFGEMVVVLFDD